MRYLTGPWYSGLKLQMNKNLYLLIFFCSSIGYSIEPMPIDSLWKSEDFRKAYTGSYGIDSRIEPLINEDESFYLTEAAKLMQSGDRKAAIQKLLDSDLVEKSPALLFSLGNFQFEEGKRAEALAYLEKALKLFPNFRDAHRNLAMLKIQTEAYDEAESHLKRAIELGSQEGLAYGLLAYCHGRKNRLQASLASYRMAQVTMPDEIQWKLGEAHALQSLGEASKALSIYDELIEKRPEDESLWINQSNNYTQTHNDIAAIAHLEFAKRMSQLSAANLLVLGHMYLQQDLSADALNNYQAAIATGDVSLTAAVEALTAFTYRWRWAEAKAFGESCSKRYGEQLKAPEPVAARSAFERAMALIELETGDAKVGAKRIETLLEKDPTDIDAIILLAKFRKNSGDIEEALLLLEQAAAFPEKRALALRSRGELLVNQGRYEEALAALRESHELEPSEALREYMVAVEELEP